MPDSLMERKNRFCLRPRVRAEALIRYVLIKHSHAEGVPHTFTPRATVSHENRMARGIFIPALQRPERHLDLHRRELQNRRNILRHFRFGACNLSTQWLVTAPYRQSY